MKEKPQKGRFCSSTELYEYLRFSKQPVSFEKAIFNTRNDLLAISRTGGLDFLSWLSNMFA